MDNRSRMDSFSDINEEIDNSEEEVSDHPSSIFDDNTGEIDKRSFGSNSGRNSSKTIPDDYERMLREQEDFLKSLDEQFNSYSSESSSSSEVSPLEEMLTAYAEPVIDEIPEINLDTEETAEFKIPEINIPDVTENPSVQEYEIPEIKIDDLFDKTENESEDTIQIPEVNLDDVAYVEPENDVITPYTPDLGIDLSDISVPENLDDTIEIQTFLDDETREIINDLNNMEEPETYSELVVEDKPAAEEEQPAEEPVYEESHVEQQVEEPEFEEVHFDAPEAEEYPEEDVVVIKDNEYEGEDSPLTISGYEPTPYQESEPEEEYNPMFDELLKDEPVNETVDEFTDTNVDEFAEEEVPEWEAFVEQFDSMEEKPAVEENNAEPVIEESVEEPVVEETAEYDPDRMPWEDMVETIDTAVEEVPYQEELTGQPAEQDYELPQIENTETIDYSDLDIQMLRDEYEDEEETEEDFDDFDIDAYIQENLSHTSNLVFPKFDDDGQPIAEETAAEPVVEVENTEIPVAEPEGAPAPEIEEPQEDGDDDYDVEASIHETFANINTQIPDFGTEYEEPVEEAEVTVEDYRPEEPETVEYAEETYIEGEPAAEVEKAEVPEIEEPLEDDEDDYDVEASIHETFASINAELPDFGKEFEEPVEEIPVEEAEVTAEDYKPEDPENVEFIEDSVVEEVPEDEEYVDIPEIEVEVPETAVKEDFNIELEPVDLEFAENEEAVDLPEIEDISFETPEDVPAAEIPEPEIEAAVPEEEPQADDEDDYDVEASIHETFASINAELPDFGKEFEEPAEELKLDLPEEEPAVEETQAPVFDYTFNVPVEKKPVPEEHVVTGRTAELRGLTDLDMTFTLDDDDSVDNIETILSEIKDYNIEKGIRNVEDTQINIISEIKKEELLAQENEPEEDEEVASVKPAEKKSFLSSFFGVSEAEIDNYEEDEEDEQPSDKYTDNTVDIPVEQYTEEEIEKTKSSIMKAIADMKPIEEGELLYDDEPTSDNEFESVYTAPQPQPQPQPQKASSYEDQEHISVLTKQIEKERIAREEMFEQTQQLKLQVSEYENELNDVTNNMSRTNRILNVILTLLIIALFVILFIMGFFFAKERGLI